MNFLDAVKIAQNNKHLIGKELKGITIDDIIIVPTNAHSQEKFQQLYVQTLNAQASIEPFKNEDVEVYIINKGLIRTQGFFLPESIYRFPEEYNVKL